LGLIGCWIDTDSENCTRVDDDGNVTCTMTIQEIEKSIQDFYDEYMKQFNLPDFNEFEHTDAITKEIVKKNHWVVFEHEKDITKALLVMPKNYAYKEWNEKRKCFEYTIKGLEMKKTSTSNLGKYMQKMVVMDALNDKLDYKKYAKELEKIKNKIFNYELDEKELKFNRPVKKRLDEYGLPMIRQSGVDKGKVWIKKDGSTRYANVPPHIKIAKKLRENGEFIPIGFKIDYIVNGHDPIVPITIDEYRRDGKYDCDYYWYSMMKPFIKVIRVLNPSFLTTYKNLFEDTKQLQSVIKEIEEDNRKELEKNDDDIYRE
jgi:DNA polymerase elongation subunit (family B)